MITPSTGNHAMPRIRWPGWRSHQAGHGRRVRNMTPVKKERSSSLGLARNSWSGSGLGLGYCICARALLYRRGYCIGVRYCLGVCLLYRRG